MQDHRPDRTLIRRLKEREASAVADLESAYRAKIYQLAFRYMRNHEDAEEVTQDVLLRVHDKIDAFRGDAALSSWIYRITFNAAMSRLRSPKFKRSLESRTSSFTPGRTTGERPCLSAASRTGRRSPTMRCTVPSCGHNW